MVLLGSLTPGCVYRAAVLLGVLLCPLKQVFRENCMDSPVPHYSFHASARAPSAPGVVQLVGGLNFQLTSGSEVYLPGSVTVDDNNASIFISETPEPGSMVLLGVGLCALWQQRSAAAVASRS